MENMEYQSVEEQLDERVIEIARVSKVVKGGRRFRYRVTVVVGDNAAHCHLGMELHGAVQHGQQKCEKFLHSVNGLVQGWRMSRGLAKMSI